MNDKVSELYIVGNNVNVFDSTNEYVIPLYQRSYAWEDKQLIQLIEDIQDVDANSNYYIGSLIVSKQNGKYEVVDGQQRLTSLYLLLNCLGYDVKHTLTFACRDKSNYTLRNIKLLLSDKRENIQSELIEPNIYRGIKIINNELNKGNYDKILFMEKLKRVIIYRIEVPENTDLNRYFEIMNTRGEQLEQHDILKAMLMGFLEHDEEKAFFAKVWDACSDMTGYVQMHFTSKNNATREAVFGSNWNGLPSSSWNDFDKVIQDSNEDASGNSITYLIKPDFYIDETDGYIDDDTRVRFESIIEFPVFLLHALRVFVNQYQLLHEDAGKKLTDELIDDKKLISAFTRVINCGMSSAGHVSDNKADFSRKFIVCLLRTRYLFDMYIIKREFANDSTEGEWSLKGLHVSGMKTKKRPYYRNSQFTRPGEWEITNDYRTKTNIMIQSALRVSYTSAKVMHWITDLLNWLSENDCIHLRNGDITKYESISEEIAAKAVRENFFDVSKDEQYAMGVNTHHIVFNFLDYLLWRSDRDGKRLYNDFVFEFRNSVEHWYPRNPSEGTFEYWKDGVDSFGNLCIIQRNVNSKFSNLSPEAKKSTFNDMINKGSIKLRIMSKLTESQGEKSASIAWKNRIYKDHQDTMVSLLKEAVYPSGK